MRTEAATVRINPEIKPVAVILSNVISPDFVAREKRSGIFSILGTTFVPDSSIGDLTKRTKKDILYNPKVRLSDRLNRDSKYIRRLSRGGRCLRTPHESADGCPTPTRCRKKGASLRVAETGTPNRAASVKIGNINSAPSIRRKRIISSEQPKTRVS